MFKNYIWYRDIMTITVLILSRSVFHINIDFGTPISKSFEFC